MSDEEKQLDNNSQQNEQSEAVSQEEQGGATATPEVELIMDNDLDSQAEFEQPSAATVTQASEEPTEASDSDSFEEAEAVGLESLRQENEALKAQLEELNGQSDSFKTQSMRIAADFDNFRKRTAKEKEDLEQQIKRNTITELLPVVDNFERARSHLKPQTDGELTIHKSYQGVYKQLVDCLKRVGVSPMRPEGQEFDPNLHEAVMREPTDQYPEGTVVEQLMRGYMLNERVLRHAMVKVAAAPEGSVSDPDGDAASVG
jgi:molecular chaperone GrpE